MSLLKRAKPAQAGALIVTICGTPGSGKTSLAATFPKPFLIRTQGEAVPRDVPASDRPAELGLTDSVDKLWQQFEALRAEEHDFKTLIVDSVTGLETLFVEHVVANDGKAKSIQQAGGGYGAGRDMVTGMHTRVRKEAEVLARKGMHVIFIAHSDIARIEPPDSEGYTQWSLRLHNKSMAAYVDSVDVVGFLRQTTALVGDNPEKKRAITDDSRVLIVHMTPSCVSKNRLGITEEIEVEKGFNPLAAYIAGGAPKAKAVTVSEEEVNEEGEA